MSRTKPKLLFKLSDSRFIITLSVWMVAGIACGLFFLTDYAKNFLLTRAALFTTLQGSPDRAMDLYSSLSRQNRLFSSQDYLAYRLTSQTVDLRSAFLKNPTNLTYLVQYSDQIHSSQDWVKTDNYFHQLTFARFVSGQSRRYANSRNPQEAKKGLIFMILAKKTLDDDVTNNQLGTLLNNQYKAYQKGVPLLEDSVQFRPRQTDTYGYLGDLYTRMKRYSLGRSYFTLSLRLNPTLYASYIAISQTFLQEEKKQEAVFYLNKAKILLPDNMNQVAQLASLFAKAEEIPDGENLLKGYIRKHPGEAEPRYRYGLYLKEAERTQEAIMQFSLSLVFNPSDDKSYWERANLYIQQSNWTKAVEDLNQAILINPTHRGYENRKQWVEKNRSDSVIDQTTH